MPGNAIGLVKKRLKLAQRATILRESPGLKSRRIDMKDCAFCQRVQEGRASSVAINVRAIYKYQARALGPSFELRNGRDKPRGLFSGAALESK